MYVHINEHSKVLCESSNGHWARTNTGQEQPPRASSNNNNNNNDNDKKYTQPSVTPRFFRHNECTQSPFLLDPRGPDQRRVENC